MLPSATENETHVVHATSAWRRGSDRTWRTSWRGAGIIDLFAFACQGLKESLLVASMHLDRTGKGIVRSNPAEGIVFANLVITLYRKD